MSVAAALHGTRVRSWRCRPFRPCARRYRQRLCRRSFRRGHLIRGLAIGHHHRHLIGAAGVLCWNAGNKILSGARPMASPVHQLRIADHGVSQRSYRAGSSLPRPSSSWVRRRVIRRAHREQRRHESVPLPRLRPREHASDARGRLAGRRSPVPVPPGDGPAHRPRARLARAQEGTQRDPSCPAPADSATTKVSRAASSRWRRGSECLFDDVAQISPAEYPTHPKCSDIRNPACRAPLASFRGAIDPEPAGGLSTFRGRVARAAPAHSLPARPGMSSMCVGAPNFGKRHGRLIVFETGSRSRDSILRISRWAKSRN